MYVVIGSSYLDIPAAYNKAITKKKRKNIKEKRRRKK